DIPESDAVGKRLSDLLFDKGQEKEFMAAIERICESGQPELPRDWQIKTPAGKEVWVYSTMFPDLREGKIHQIFCMDVDITIRKREEQTLIALGTNLRNLYERSADAIMLIEDDRFLDVNPAALKLFGYTNKSDMVGRYPEDISPPMQPDGKTSKDKAREMLALARKNGNHRFEWQHNHSNQQTFWAEVLLTEIPGNNNPLLYVLVRDISVRKATEQSLQLAAQAFENSHEGILIADKDHRIILVNRALSKITGYPPSEVIGNRPQLLYSSMRDPGFFQSILDTLITHNHWQGELWGQRPDGYRYPFSLSITAVRDAKHEIINYIAIVTDISERKAAEEKMQHMAEHDALTGLPNRVLLLDRLQQAIVASQRNDKNLAILFLDLDRFKYINDSFGHHIGDKLLQSVAERLKKCVRSIDTVSRLGGDEFVIMLVDVGNGEPTAHIADNILNAINVPYSIEGCEFNITTCIGISTYPNDSEDMDTLIKNADIAMYHAKDNCPNSYQFFDHDMNTRIVERLMLENNLRSALKKNEFILHYQPQMNIVGDQTIGAEALIRWEHPTFGLIFPDQFIRVAEECGLIVPIGDWVLRTACQQAKAWQEHGIQLVVAVNLSVAQFHQKSLLQSVIGALQAANLEPHYLELEITESILMDEEKSAIATLRALREMGVKVAIDDFGTGFSSLNYLKHIPIDKLKIDQSFVHDITVDAEDAAIINAIIVMAKGLKLKVIAEGVETLEQYQFLESHGCDEYQGHYSSKALQPQEFLEFVGPAA
ncbi:MAG: sensor domain-containing protein, partial [Burkholderiaceae bacterium]